MTGWVCTVGAGRIAALVEAGAESISAFMTTEAATAKAMTRTTSSPTFKHFELKDCFFLLLFFI